MHIRILSLSSTGSALIASQIPWFTFSPLFPIDHTPQDPEEYLLDRDEPKITYLSEPNPKISSKAPETTPSASNTPQKEKTPQPESLPTPERQTSQPKSKKPKKVQMNILPPDTFLRDSYKTIKGNYLEKYIDQSTNNMVFKTSSNPDVTVYIKSISRTDSEKMDFTLYFETYEDQYENYSTDNINIFLFTKPAWNSSTGEDEYGTKLTRDQINELFALGLDNKKLKQLLLSLSSKRIWKTKGRKWNNKDQYESQNGGWMRPNRLDNLSELKINYFSDFSGLKEYIQKKSTVCTTEGKSCIADKKELTFFDYDEYEFFNNTEKRNRTY